MDEMQTTVGEDETALIFSESEAGETSKGTQKDRKEVFQINTHPTTVILANNKRDRRLKQIVMRVVAFCKREHEEGQQVPFRFFKKRASLMTGVSLSTIHRIETFDLKIPPFRDPDEQPSSSTTKPKKEGQQQHHQQQQQQQKKKKAKKKKKKKEECGEEAAKARAKTALLGENTEGQSQSAAAHGCRVSFQGAAGAATPAASKPPSKKKKKKAKKDVEASSRSDLPHSGGSSTTIPTTTTTNPNLNPNLNHLTTIPNPNLIPHPNPTPTPTPPTFMTLQPAVVHAVSHGEGLVTAINVQPTPALGHPAAVTPQRAPCSWTARPIGPFAMGGELRDGRQAQMPAPHLQVNAAAQQQQQQHLQAVGSSAMPVGPQLQPISVATAATAVVSQQAGFVGQVDGGGQVHWTAAPGGGMGAAFGALPTTATLVGGQVLHAYPSHPQPPVAGPTLTAATPAQQNQPLQHSSVFYQF